MRKVILTLGLLVSTVSFAQNNKFKEDAIKYIELSGGTSQITAVLDTYINELGAYVEDMNAFKKDIEKTYPKLYSDLADIYTKNFTHDEIKQMIKFYETPVGKKMRKLAPTLTEQQMQAGTAWGVELQGIITKHVKME